MNEAAETKTEIEDWRARIADVVAEESANGAAVGWRPCTGCHETCDGHEVGHYPHSDVFGCSVGSGCSECGGLGVVWEYWSKEALDDMQGDARRPSISEGVEAEARAVAQSHESPAGIMERYRKLVATGVSYAREQNPIISTFEIYMGPFNMIGDEIEASISALSAELEKMKAERDRQYDENVDRIAKEGAAILRATTAEAENARLKEKEKELLSFLKYWNDGNAIIEKCLSRACAAATADAPFGMDDADAAIWHEAQRNAYRHALEMMGIPAASEPMIRAALSGDQS